LTQRLFAKYKSVIPAQAGIQNVVNVTGSRPDDHPVPTLNLKNKHPRLLLVGPSQQLPHCPYLNAAQSLGVDVLIASISKHSLVSAVAEDLLATHKVPPHSRYGNLCTRRLRISAIAGRGSVLWFHFCPGGQTRTEQNKTGRSRFAGNACTTEFCDGTDLEIELTVSREHCCFTLSPLENVGWNKRSGSTSRLIGSNKSPLYSRPQTKKIKILQQKPDSLKQEKKALVQ